MSGQERSSPPVHTARLSSSITTRKKRVLRRCAFRMGDRRRQSRNNDPTYPYYQQLRRSPAEKHREWEKIKNKSGQARCRGGFESGHSGAHRQLRQSGRMWPKCGICRPFPCLPAADRAFPHRSMDRPGLRLGEEFFQQPCISLAKAFLGKVLVRRCADGAELRGRIVETEAYLGGEDQASHSAGGKRTKRNTAMFMRPGTIYVYPIYGIYLCMNVSSEGEGAAVLLRSVEPLQGQSVMRRLRAARRKEGARQLKDKELCNGPSKLCQALDIPRAFDCRDLASDPEVWLEGDPNTSPVETYNIVSAPRVGIESHGEWAKKPWRFYVRGHPCVSVLNKEAERQPQSGNVLNDLGSSDVQPDTGQNHVKRT